MTNNEVAFLNQNIGKLGEIRNSKVAYAVVKNAKKLAKENEIIVESLNKLRGETDPDEYIKSKKGKEFIGAESSINLHLLEEIPEELDLTANELGLLQMMTKSADDDGKPEGPTPK